MNLADTLNVTRTYPHNTGWVYTTFLTLGMKLVARRTRSMWSPRRRPRSLTNEYVSGMCNKWAFAIESRRSRRLQRLSTFGRKKKRKRMKFQNERLILIYWLIY